MKRPLESPIADNNKRNKFKKEVNEKTSNIGKDDYEVETKSEIKDESTEDFEEYEEYEELSKGGRSFLIGVGWLKKLDKEGQLKLAEEYNVILPDKKGKFKNRDLRLIKEAVATLDENGQKMIRQKYLPHIRPLKPSLKKPTTIGINWVKTLDLMGQIKLAEELNVILSTDNERTMLNYTELNKIKKALAAVEKKSKKVLEHKYHKYTSISAEEN